MPKIDLKSGNKVVINPAPFKDAMALKNAIQKEFAESDFNFDFDPSKDIKSQNLDIAAIGKMVALVDSSETVYAALLKCLSRCTYNQERISEATFEPVEARADYYEIVFACVKENISPFFESLLSRFLPAINTIRENMATKQTEKSPE